MTNTKTLKIPMKVVRENTIKIIGTIFNLLDNKNINIENMNCTITIQYSNFSILTLHHNIDVKILKCILYYIKLNNNTINSICKQFDNGDLIKINMHKDDYEIKINENYIDILTARVKLLCTCKNTNLDTISIVDIRDIDRNVLIELIGKKIKVKNCESIKIDTVNVNIIQGVDLLIIIDIDKTYIIDLYDDFKSKRIALEYEVAMLSQSRSKHDKYINKEYSFV